MLSQFIANAIVFLPLVLGSGQPAQPVQVTRYEAESITVYEDGSFTLSANDEMYTGCLPAISYEGGYPEGIIPAACNDGGTHDDITLFEDGSAIWHYSESVEIAGCFLKDWGCAVDETIYGYTAVPDSTTHCFVTNNQTGATFEIEADPDLFCWYDVTPGNSYTITVLDHAMTFVALDHTSEYTPIN